MLVDFEFDGNRPYVNGPHRDEFLADVEKRSGPDVAKAWAGLKWSDVMERLGAGVYEFWDVNAHLIPMHGVLLGVEKLNSREYLPMEMVRSLWPEVYAHVRPEENGKVWTIHPYGVCDDWRQIFSKMADRMRPYIDSPEPFVVFVSKIAKKSQPEEGGWRWEKWGEYIGDKQPQYEYLYDEPEIDEVFVFEVYHVIPKESKC